MKRKGLTAAETSATQKSGIRLSSSPMLTVTGGGGQAKRIFVVESFLIDLFEAGEAGN